MNRSEEIRSTLAQAEQGEAPGGDGWAATYRDHVAYLLRVLRDFTDHDIHARLREQSRQLADLARTVRYQRRVIAALTVVVAFVVLVGLATVHSQAAPRPTEAPGPVVEFTAGGDSDGTYCTPWEPTGEPCSGGGCLWHRWCTDCVPGCDWYRETDCRPSPGVICPFFAPGDGAGIGGKGAANSAIDGTDSDRSKQP